MKTIDRYHVNKQKLFITAGLLIMSVLLAGCGTMEELLNPETGESSTQDLSAATTTPVVLLNAEEVPEILPTSAPLSVTDENFPQISDEAWLLYLGEYDQAKVSFSTIVADSTSTQEEKAQANLGLGRIALIQNEFDLAINHFDSIHQQYPATLAATDAYFFLGEVYTALGKPDVAAAAYSQFAHAAPQTLSTMIWEKIADAYTAAQDYPNAINAYQSAINATQDIEFINSIKGRIGLAYAAQNEYEIAVQYYLDAFNNSSNDYFKAQMNFYLGQAYLVMGFTESAYERFLLNVNQYPFAYDSYSGLVALIDAGQSVDEYQRGLTDYYAGAYGVAVDAFNRYIETTPIPNRNGNAHHFKALSLIALEEYEAAISEWQFLIDNYPDNSYFATAFDEIALTQWAYLTNPKLAAETYLSYAETFYYRNDAADFMFYAARMYERADEFLLAAQTWGRIATDFPDSSLVFRSLQLSGISYYRLKDYTNSASVFNSLYNAALTDEDRASAAFWLAKTKSAEGNTEEATKQFTQTVKLAPFSFYGIRASQIISETPIFTVLEPMDYSPDWLQERKEAVIWMNSVFDLPPGTDLQSLGSLANDAGIIRARDYWRLGFYQESLAEFEKVRSQIGSDPSNTFRLIPLLMEHGFFRSAAFASRQILDMANIAEDDLLTAPRYFNHIRYGTFYEPYLTQAAQSYGIEPLILFSQIRQESLYESRVGSSAGAIGLMQIIPSTGSSISAQMKYPADYETSMLYLPSVNIKMGTFYLQSQINYFDGSILPALAAYNAGPGNAAAWLALANDDIDLFFEIVRFTETRNYLTHIVENFSIYTQLYKVVEPE